MAEAAPAEKLLENDICRGDRRNDSFPGARRADKKFPMTFTSLPERETIGRFHLVPLWSPSAKETPSKTGDFEITDPPERFFLILSLSVLANFLPRRIGRNSVQVTVKREENVAYERINFISPRAGLLERDERKRKGRLERVERASEKGRAKRKRAAEGWGGETRVRTDGRMEEGIIWRVRGRGKASFYRGRHLPTDRHYRAK